MGVVVTGASGFIGANLVRSLAEGGYDGVVGIDRRPGLPGASLVADLAAPNLDPAAADALRDADVVWHLAASPGVRTTGPDAPRRRQLDNVVAGAAVARLVRPGAHLIVTSSSSVYGGALGRGVRLRASREGDALKPRGDYARSKVELEGICAHRVLEGGRTTVVRPFTVAGERQRDDMAFARWIKDVRAGRPVTVLGSPARTRDVTDVRDVVAGLIAVAERGATGTFNLGSGVARTLDDMLAAVFAAMGASVPLVVEPARPEEVPATLADITRARTYLGYAPNTDLEDIVRRQVASVAVLGGRP